MRISICIGLNYPGTQFQLNGCELDARNMAEWFRTVAKYDKVDVLLNPTKARLVKSIVDACKLTHLNEVKELCISYSGHGSNQKDVSGDEADGMDEGLVPVDFESSGLLLDDELNALMRTVNTRTQVYWFVDACHSGTILDLQYRMDGRMKHVVDNRNAMPQSIICLSGCGDPQVSEESVVRGRVQGALTVALLHQLRVSRTGAVRWHVLAETVRDALRKGGHSQVPQLTSSKKLSSLSRWSFVPLRRSTRKRKRRVPVAPWWSTRRHRAH